MLVKLVKYISNGKFSMFETVRSVLLKLEKYISEGI